MTGIICALNYEAELIISQITEKKIDVFSGIPFTSGKLNGKDIVIAVCGVGKVFAAICTQTMILKYSPDTIINSGVAGAIDPSLKCGDITIATSVVQHDMDTSPLGDPIGLISGINIVNFPCSDKKELIEKIAKSHNHNILTGVIASGDQFVASTEKKDYIQNNFNAVACDMEAASIGHVCYVNNTDFCIIRAISDSADGDAHLDYPTFAAAAAKNAAEILCEYISIVDK